MTWIPSPSGTQKERYTISQRKHSEEAEMMRRQDDDEVILRKVKLKLITEHKAGEDREI